MDRGFRVLKLDTTNMKDVYYTPDAYEPGLLDSLADNIKEDRTPEDLLFQVMPVSYTHLGGCKKKGKREASGYFSPVGTGSFRSECFGNDGAFIGGYREHAADVEIITQP